MNICLSKKNFSLGNTIEGIVTDNDWNDSIEVIKITKYFDYIIYTEIVLQDNLFSFNINDPGLYICRGCKPNTDIKAFSYGLDEGIDVDNTIMNIYKDREESFSREKYADEGGNKHFDIYMFCENVNPKADCEYDDVRIIPYDYFNQMGEFAFVNRFMKDYTVTNSILSEADYSNRYSAVLKMVNVVAVDQNSAGKYATDRMSVLLNLYALRDICNPRVIMSVVLDRDTKQLFKYVNYPKFSGNLLQIGDYGEAFLDYYHVCVQDKQLRFLLTLIRDAYSEMMADIRTYRLWLVLEYITYIFNYDDKLSEKDRVDKLIKEETPDYYNEPSCYGLKTEDFLDICLQRRNCCAHQGGCIAGSDGKCSTNLTKSKERREKCRPHPVQDTHFMNDGICQELEWLVKRLIYIAIDHRSPAKIPI